MQSPCHGVASILLVLALPSLARADVFIVTESAGNAVSRVSSVGVISTVAGSGLDDPEGVAIDADGNIFVADAGSSRVLMIPAGGVPVQVGDAVSGPSGLAFDDQGVLYVATTGDDQVRKLNAGVFETFATLPAGASPQGLAFTPGGTLFVANEGLDTISEVTPEGDVSEFSDDVTEPFGVTVSAAGKLHVSDTANGGRIVTFNPNGKTHPVATGLGDLLGISFDHAGDLFFVTGTGELRKVVNNGSQAIAPGLDGPRFLAARSAQTRIVAVKGQQLSDPAGATLASVGAPALGGGAVAFKGTLVPGLGGVAASNALGIWRADSEGTLSLVVRKAFAAPGVSGAVFASFGDPVLNASGDVAFLGTLAKGVGGVTGADSKGVWADIDATLTLVARQGDDAPGLDPGVTFASFKQLVLPDDAGPAVLATVAGPGISGKNNLGLWSADTDGVLSLVVRKGDTVSVGSDRVLKSLDLFKPTSLSTGQARNVANGRQFTFRATFTDGSHAILLAQPGQAPVAVVAQGDAVGPAVDPGTFASLGSPCVADAGTEVGFAAKLVPGVGDITPASSAAVFSQSTEAVLEARRTFPAPDTNGAVFASLSDPVVNGSNALALVGKLKPGIGDASSGNAGGLWADAGAGLGLVVRLGDAAPGIPGAATFKALRQFVLPDTGGALFTAKLAGTSGSRNQGLWAADGAGALELLLAKGDTLAIDGANRQVSTITAFKALAGVGGQSRSFDAAGSVALLVKCTDGTQTIVHIQQP